MLFTEAHQFFDLISIDAIPAYHYKYGTFLDALIDASLESIDADRREIGVLGFFGVQRDLHFFHRSKLSYTMYLLNNAAKNNGSCVSGGAQPPLVEVEVAWTQLLKDREHVRAYHDARCVNRIFHSVQYEHSNHLNPLWNLKISSRVSMLFFWIQPITSPSKSGLQISLIAHSTTSKARSSRARKTLNV